ncbi:hypothetical protein PMG11_11192 [Penicillium brasilianum]|uniref:Uncharacterized protein n=1 Tax=Penicillium brasilianum TaxID=104259 RepID=A0A0F7U148_PENBI|nr:hypothetical protein PMG11_11192 [Penicillium brasilianum]
MSTFGLALLPLCSLVVASPVADQLQSVDIPNPPASDLKIPPKQISFTTCLDNPFPNGIPTQLGKWDGKFPPDDRFRTMRSSGGYLYYEKDSRCSDTEKNILETALWEAATLASYSSNLPNNGAGSRGSASALCKESCKFSPITLTGTYQSPSSFSSSIPPGSSGIRYPVSVKPGVSPRPSPPPKTTVSLSSSVSLGTEHTSSELFGKVGDTLSPGPVTVGSKTGIYGLTTFIPIISGGPIISPSATSNPTLEIIAPTSTEAQSSISHLSVELVGLIRKINSWVEHPDVPEATGVIHAIENIHPDIEGLLSKLEPEPGSRSCKSTSRKRIKRDLSSRSAFLSLFDLVDNTLCSVNDIKNNVRDNILNDVKSNLKDLQNAVDNLPQDKPR